MVEKRPLFDRLVEKMESLSVTRRKARELATGLVSTFQRKQTGGVSVTAKLVARLMKLGLTEIKAKELAKGLAPVVRASVKAKQKLRDAKGSTAVAKPGKSLVDEAVEEVTDAAENEALDKVAPRVNGHRVRLDLPILPWNGNHRGVDVLRVVHGYTTHGTYLVTAVKGESEVVAVRRLRDDYYNVKFYPTMAAWGRTVEELSRLGAKEYLNRGPYERMHCSAKVTTAILDILAAEAKPRRGIKGLLGRMKVVAFAPLEKAFGYLYKRVHAAA